MALAHSATALLFLSPAACGEWGLRGRNIYLCLWRQVKILMHHSAWTLSPAPLRPQMLSGLCSLSEDRSRSNSQTLSAQPQGHENKSRRERGRIHSYSFRAWCMYTACSLFCGAPMSPWGSLGVGMTGMVPDQTLGRSRWHACCRQGSWTLRLKPGSLPGSKCLLSKVSSC